jgi:hypothetical protein
MTTRLIGHDSGAVAEQPIDVENVGPGIVTTFANPLGNQSIVIGAYGDGDTTAPGRINIYDADANMRLQLMGDGSILGQSAVGATLFEVWSAATFATSVTSPRFISTVAAGTMPFTVASTTKVVNLNADYLDGYDATAFEAAGTTSTHAALTAAHGATGAVVGTTNSQTLTNKTIVAANNTITTAASGNLAATELNAALAELQGDIDSISVKGNVEFFRAVPPGSSYATTDIRTGASSPAESVQVYDFDASSIEYMDFMCRLSGYQGGGLTFTIPWSATSATSGTTRWGIAIRRLAAGSDDLDVSHTYDFNDVDSTAPATNGSLAYATVTFTHGSDMDDLAEGEVAIVRVRRNASHVNDNMTGDAELHGLYAKET